MKKYKRTTKRLMGSNAPFTEYASDNEILNRLAELEDKIENGTLVTIPFIWKHKKVENAFMVVYESEHGDLLGQMFCSETAKEEAEKFLEQKLKELKGEV